MLLILSKTTHAPLAAIVTAFSTYFTGLCINASRAGCVLSPTHGSVRFNTSSHLRDYRPQADGPSKIGQMGGFGGSAGLSHIEWWVLLQVYAIEKQGRSETT